MIDHDANTRESRGSDRRRQLLGVWVWILSAQFFLAQVLVQLAWQTPFSLRTNYISDLGNTTCGPSRVGSVLVYVCSPWHSWMNLSFIVLGVAIVLGAALLTSALPAGPIRAVGVMLLALAGPGIIAVGLYPEDVNLPLHKAGAGLQFICGNLAIVVLGGAMVGRTRRGSLAMYSILSGGIGLMATGLFAYERYLGLGVGGMERLAAYPLPVWLIVIGACWRRASASSRTEPMV